MTAVYLPIDTSPCWAVYSTWAALRLLLEEAESVQLEAETSPLWFHIQPPSAGVTVSVKKQRDWRMYAHLLLHLRALLHYSGPSGSGIHSELLFPGQASPTSLSSL